MVQSRAGSEGTVGMMVRMPAELRDHIKAAAEKNGRSQNSEIVATLEGRYSPMNNWLVNQLIESNEANNILLMELKRLIASYEQRLRNIQDGKPPDPEFFQPD